MTESEDPEPRLRAMVGRLVSGEWSVDEFQDEFYEYFVEGFPEDALSAASSEFYSAVHEGLDWTDAAPDRESLRYGWIDHKQYVAWVRQALVAFEAGSPLPERPSNKAYLDSSLNRSGDD